MTAAGAGATPDDASAAPDDAVAFTPGEVALLLANESDRPLVAVLEREEWDPQAATAAEVTALQEFRDLFSSEVLAPGQEIGVQTLAVLFTDLKGSTSLYEGAGDAPAYGRVNRHFEFLRERLVAHRGAVVKTIGDAVMGAFLRIEDALAAAVEIQAALEGWCAERRIQPPLVLKIGVHHGPVIAVNANDRLDYFGRTVNLAARLGRESGGGDVALLGEVADDAAVRASLGRAAAAAGVRLEAETFRARLRGIADECEIVRLRVADPRPAPPG